LRFRERFGESKVPRPIGNLIWFNAVSVGEVNSAWTIINRINQESEYNILITTTTTTSATITAEKIKQLQKPEKVIHQFFPVDITRCVENFLNHWRPNVFVNVESEIWPNVLTLTKKYCPIIILNGKMSKKSFRFWYYVAKTFKEQVFDSVDLCLAQSKRDFKKFINLGLQRVQFFGNIKFFVEKQPVDMEYLNLLKDMIGKRRFWLVNCTHDGEEEIIIQTHKILKEKHSDILTLNVLRHPKRLEEVVELMKKNDLDVSVASKGENINNDTDFYIYDKIGGLSTLFELSDVVFIAGSLKPKIGGHTPTECIKYGCCVVTGPYIDNNRTLYKDLLDNKACIVLKDNKANTIAKTIDNLFENEELKNNIISEAYAKSIKSNACLNEIINKIFGMAL
jgi:3-deoxy-D-manno-octulosonic-acid transferase